MRSALLILCLLAAGCASKTDVKSGGSKGKAADPTKGAELPGEAVTPKPAAPEDTFVPAGEPIAVSGTNLTVDCSWSKVSAADDVRAACYVAGEVPAGATFAWSVPATATGVVIEVGQNADRVEFTAKRSVVAGLSMNVAVTVFGVEAPVALVAPLVSKLPGLGEGSALGACLATTDPLSGCFVAAGLGVQADGTIGGAPLSGGCAMTALPTIVRKGRPDVVKLTLSATGDAPVASFHFEDLAFANGNLVAESPTVIDFQPSTLNVAANEKIRFSATNDAGATCFVEVKAVNFEMKLTGQTILVEAQNAGERGRIKADYLVHNLSPTEIVAEAKAKTVSEDFADYIFTVGAKTCDAGICSQALSVEFTTQFLTGSTLYRGQIYNVIIDAGQGANLLAIDFSRNITVKIGAGPEIIATYDGVAGAP